MENSASKTGSALVSTRLFFTGAAKETDVGSKAAKQRAEASPKREIGFMTCGEIR
ncbi:hypothetical protein GCM10023213_09520 [Prosthecobacter algae]|uniref:Uncharacterized protein n=1 Tax=Prosthecobacter algae TaxID=1144682 RepID=A0ABP9NX31_9BACT